MDKLVVMDDVIGHLAVDYGIPLMRFDDLVTLAQRAINVYHLESSAKRISFDEICEYIHKYVSTPFGARVLKELNSK